MDPTQRTYLTFSTLGLASHIILSNEIYRAPALHPPSHPSLYLSNLTTTSTLEKNPHHVKNLSKISRFSQIRDNEIKCPHMYRRNKTWYSSDLNGKILFYAEESTKSMPRTQRDSVLESNNFHHVQDHHCL